MEKLKILQIGAGSMGTRRLRDLSTREELSLSLFDAREDRRLQAEDAFGITTFAKLDTALAAAPDALIISTPPDQHEKYISIALDNSIHHFCEEHIWTYDPLEIAKVGKRSNIVCASSCSFHFLPVVRKLKEIVETELGSLHSYQMVLSTYMPTWHPKEGVEFYARNRNTAAGREMVPFELLWLNHVFGTSKKVSGSVNQYGKLENGDEDTWSLQMMLENGGSGQLTVMQGSPAIIRQGICAGDNGSVEFNIITGTLKTNTVLSPDNQIECGDTKNVLEKTYHEEINTFVDIVLNGGEWPVSYFDSAIATATLASLEKSSSSGEIESVDILQQPTFLDAT